MNTPLTVGPIRRFVSGIKRLVWLPCSLCCLLTGCMNLSGLGGSADYACKAPEGVTCDSVSGTYANAIQDNLPSQRGKRRGMGKSIEGAGQLKDRPARNAQTQAAPSNSAPTPVGMAALASPLRSASRILRLWFKPWEDADRDLYDQGYVYVQIDAGQWLIDHAQRQIRDAYAPIRPPVKRVPSGATQPGTPGSPAVEPTATPTRPSVFQRLTPDTGPLLPPGDSPLDAND
ncbi:MAG: type IV conjugative transfer system lipoprotein TraV [Pseudomonadota bacterium]